MRLIIAFLTISMALCSGLANSQEASTKDAKVYKWVDENGTVHYSTKPEDAAAAAEEVKLRRGPSAPEAGPVTPVADPEEVKRCEQLRKNLALLESDTANLEISENGKVRPMTDDERAPQLAATREALKRCDTVPAAPPQ
jgi:hypothetical protein